MMKRLRWAWGSFGLFEHDLFFLNGPYQDLGRTLPKHEH